MSVQLAQIIASSILVYPDHRFLNRREELLKLSESLDDNFGLPLIAFFNATNQLTIDSLAKHYVEVFDMRRKCSLFLTSWTHGDTRNRGMALLHFKEIYRESGMVLTDEELPDHLAVVLEFAAIKDPIAGRLLLGEHRAPIELLKTSLHEINSYYAFVLDAIVATLPAMTPELAERARALALSGPPKEYVGLSGAVNVALLPFSSSQSLISDGGRR